MDPWTTWTPWTPGPWNLDPWNPWDPWDPLDPLEVEGGIVEHYIAFVYNSSLICDSISNEMKPQIVVITVAYKERPRDIWISVPTTV